MTLLTSWDDAFNVVIDIFMKIMDWMWKLKLPATDIPLYAIWIIGGILGIVMRLVGSAPQLSTMSQNTIQATRPLRRIVAAICGKSTPKEQINRFSEHKKSQIENNKNQLLSLAKQAKTREESFKRVHTTQRINKE